MVVYTSPLGDNSCELKGSVFLGRKACGGNCALFVGQRGGFPWANPFSIISFDNGFNTLITIRVIEGFFHFEESINELRIGVGFLGHGVI